MNYTALMLSINAQQNLRRARYHSGGAAGECSTSSKCSEVRKTTAGRNLLEMARSRFLFKLKLKLVAQKGRCIGERGKHSVAAFWDDWHELDEENLDLLDIDRLIPPDW
ncbi:hypothetical protein FOMG_14326 [Fusarium oxysporum f. sp. melonis 26406]|uniref:Uncharacterized protein n=1 Tax=Fusarium oxysporum f. sp. melonis 26406 TaxID=1089452 RepID=W9ZKR1_FUSOX|nr:hypothetical protein FOMG_14326 [Fusarium oxysporum f. sp. melonis 26406]